MAKECILIVDDELAIRTMLHFVLQRAGFSILQAANTANAKTLIQQKNPNLLLLDLMLPGQSGISLTQELRKNSATKNLPIIMLTAKSHETDKVQGLTIGADDYITKPFSPAELVARIKSLLRRAKPAKEHMQSITIQYGLSLNQQTREVIADQQLIKLSAVEFKLLTVLFTKPEQVFSRGQLLDQVWGVNHFIEERTVDVHIRRLRKALATTGHDSLIQTVRGFGYRFSKKAMVD